jgi:hypothetical protein
LFETSLHDPDIHSMKRIASMHEIFATPSQVHIEFSVIGFGFDINLPVKIA